MSTPTSPAVVAFLGPEGSYSHQTTAQRFPDRSTHTLRAQPSIAAVFKEVQTGVASLGVVPFENSSNGPVAFTLDLFAEGGGGGEGEKDEEQTLRGVRVQAEIYLPVHHCLVGPRGVASSSSSSSTAAAAAAAAAATPQSLERFAGITKLYSHPQAWGQCRRFLAAHAAAVAAAKGNGAVVERTDTASTSRAAAIAGADASGASGAISSALAAELLGLEVWTEGIEDDVGGNCTRFLVLGRDGEAWDLGALKGQQEGKAEFKTLLCFALSPAGTRTPGALADALAVFKAHGISLTSINTRPSGRGSWEYVFFVEVVGRRRRRRELDLEGEGNGEGKVEEALGELGKVVGWLRWLGSWEDAMGEV